MEWEQLFKNNILQGGQEFYQKDTVKELKISDTCAEAVVKGIEDFAVRIEFAGDKVSDMSCSCMYAKSGFHCKHMAAVLYACQAFPRKAVPAAAPEPETEENPVEVSETEVKSEEAANPEEKPVPEDTAEPEVNPIQETASASKAASSLSAQAPEPSGGFSLSADIHNFFHYALQQNHCDLIRSVSLKNNSDQSYADLTLKVNSDSGLIDELVLPMEDEIAAGQEVLLRSVKAKIHGEFLASLTERVSCLLYISLWDHSRLLARHCEEITVLAFDEWPGARYSLDLLAAYVQPNHPVVGNLQHAASRWLEEWTGNPALNAYQSGDPNRVIQMAAAAYAAVQEKNITYAEAPASFEDIGQRIRLADEMLSLRLGTCMDFTLFIPIRRYWPEIRSCAL